MISGLENVDAGIAPVLLIGFLVWLAVQFDWKHILKRWF